MRFTEKQARLRTLNELHKKSRELAREYCVAYGFEFFLAPRDQFNQMITRIKELQNDPNQHCLLPEGFDPA